MSREVRRVPANWEHPKDTSGKFIPLYASFPYTEEEVREGLEDNWLKDEPPYYGCDVMPQWTDAERTHYQMYECTSEGTPISPVIETPGLLAQWLVDNHATVFADIEATSEYWLNAIHTGCRVMAVFSRSN
ncbi:MAG: hypothetical protein AAB845_02610 [Patescibacteria group bacterium]